MARLFYLSIIDFVFSNKNIETKYENKINALKSVSPTIHNTLNPYELKSNSRSNSRNRTNAFHRRKISYKLNGTQSRLNASK